jgi:hypothetical protein
MCFTILSAGESRKGGNMLSKYEQELVDLGRQKVRELLQEYGDKTCPDCGHSNWAHGIAGCSATWGKCGCKKVKSNRQIIFGDKDADL